MVSLKIIKILSVLRLFPIRYFLLSNSFKFFEYNELMKKVQISKDDVILDFGCGGGLNTLLIGKKCKKIIGLDINYQSIYNAKNLSDCTKQIKSEFICAKLEEAAFTKNLFDKIFSFCVIEHVEDFDSTVKEIFRILKPGGQFIFSVDSLSTIKNDEIINKHKKDHYVKKYFKSDELKDSLSQHRFKKIEIYPIFRSDYSRDLFIDGINTQFKVNKIRSIINYYILKLSEQKTKNNNEGIFLLIKCVK